MSMAKVSGSSGWLTRSICASQTSNGMTALVLASSQMPRRSRRNSTSGMAARSRSMCSAVMRMPRAGLAWPRRRVVAVGAVVRGPLVVGQAGAVALDPALAHLGELEGVLQAGAAGVPDLRVRPGRQGGQHGGHLLGTELVGLVEDDAVGGEATARALGPGDEPQAVAVAELDAFLAVAGADAGHVPAQFVAAVDHGLDPRERLGRRLVLVRGVHDQALVEQEQAGELAGQQHLALPVLAGDDQADLEGRPLAVLALAQGPVEHVRLPGVQVDTEGGAELDGLLAGRAQMSGNDSIRGRCAPITSSAASWSREPRSVWRSTAVPSLRVVDELRGRSRPAAGPHRARRRARR
jgi:hypothetical protein